MSNAEIESEELSFEMFTEPEGFRPKTPEPTQIIFTRPNESQLTLNLITPHSLWGHCLWNAGKSMANYLDVPQNGKRILELGAAAALPSIICALNGGDVLATDYPDPNIISNIKLNGSSNIPASLSANFNVEGFIWGHDSSNLVKDGLFDMVLMADLIFNHSEHGKMLKTCKECLAKNGIVLTTFSHHIPKFADRNMKFFEAATEMGFEFEMVYQETWPEMFPEDEGDVQVRRTVHCYQLWLP